MGYHTVLKVCRMSSQMWWCHYLYDEITIALNNYENLGKQKIYNYSTSTQYCMFLNYGEFDNGWHNEVQFLTL